ncbi:MAG: HAMP domain-containing protein [Leptolyngbyaceae cyanobacterium CRU_2_3]|nr:HAMP domain-containing protein [Leptolyngbyaceae cyanobacterium CRU_2_3]
MLGILALGYWFAEGLEQNIQRDVESFAERVQQDFYYEQQTLKAEVELMSDRDDLRQAIERRDARWFLKVLLPLKASLELDWVKVLDIQGNVLADVRKNILTQASFEDKALGQSTVSGSNLIDLVSAKQPDQRQTLLVASHVIVHSQDDSDRPLGGLMIGRLIDDTLLQKIATGSSKYLLALVDNQVTATTLSAGKFPLTWQPPGPDNIYASRSQLGDQQYFAKSFVIAGSSASLLTVILYPITVLEAAVQVLWLRLGILFLLGSTIISLVGGCIARSLTQPILKLTRMTQQLANGDTTVRVPNTGRDEVAQLGRAFNQMAEQLAERGFLNQKIQELQNILQNLQKDQAQLIHTEKCRLWGNWSLVLLTNSIPRWGQFALLLVMSPVP